ncbi:MAG: hypothetical protein Q4D87_06140 [Actinomycetaceae bacterium]|nr:hypothetical protein [Actinomycetaceae bacterium]
MTVKSTWKRVAVGLTGAALALGLAACSAQPGVAVSVNGETYTEDAVGEVSLELSQIFGQFIEPAAVASLLIVEPAVVEVADANGIEFTEADARKRLASFEEEAGEPLSDATVSVFRMNELLKVLGSGPDAQAAQIQIAEAIQGLDAELNPRYGELDENNLMLPVTLDGVIDMREVQPN